MSAAAPIQIWIRHRGARRQAFYRHDRTCPWTAMQVKHADKALRDGTMKLGAAVVAVVSRETSETPQHPEAEAFRAMAANLSQQIDAINGTGASA